MYEQKALFDSSMMTNFRKRFNAQAIKDIDELLHSATRDGSKNLMIITMMCLLEMKVPKLLMPVVFLRIFITQLTLD